MREYIAIIHKDPDSDYGVSFPDLPGCVTAGATLGEARLRAVEALTSHLEELAAKNETVPEPSTLESIMGESGKRIAVAVFVSAPAPVVRSVRINIILPADMLEEIDHRAEEDGFTRSGFLAQAARKALAL